ncbi:MULTISPECIES: AraC family transcriptional regulator [Rhodomicrobium]|uniref:helix-turn-helix domain-containing protein n=1 Tax=Rhodomicrobium TaxID=1068 RepID=UPI001482C671|nr:MULTISPECIES: AraC family transcriptional regulator [Rhodomicrobium]
MSFVQIKSTENPSNIVFPNFLPRSAPADRSEPTPQGPEDDGKRDVDAIIVLLLKQAELAWESDLEGAKVCVKHACSLLQTERARNGAELEQPAEGPARGGLAPWQVRRVISHIDAHLDSQLTGNELAGIATLSNGHFSRAFKESTGQTPHAYVTRRRIQRAQAMMLAGDEPLCQIALTCGFADQAHFSRLFRRLVGVSPNGWRRERRVGAQLVEVKSRSFM